MPPKDEENTENAENQSSQTATDAAESETSETAANKTEQSEEPCSASPNTSSEPVSEPNENELKMGVDFSNPPDATASETSETAAPNKSEAALEDNPHPFAAFRGMLFPESKESYEVRPPEERVIPKDAWKWLKKEASKIMADSTIKPRPFRAHLYDIICEKPPFGYRVEGKDLEGNNVE